MKIVLILMLITTGLLLFSPKKETEKISKNDKDKVHANGLKDFFNKQVLGQTIGQHIRNVASRVTGMDFSKKSTNEVSPEITDYSNRTFKRPAFNQGGKNSKVMFTSGGNSTFDTSNQLENEIEQAGNRPNGSAWDKFMGKGKKWYKKPVVYVTAGIALLLLIWYKMKKKKKKSSW